MDGTLLPTESIRIQIRVTDTIPAIVLFEENFLEHSQGPGTFIFPGVGSFQLAAGFRVQVFASNIGPRAIAIYTSTMIGVEYDA